MARKKTALKQVAPHRRAVAKGIRIAPSDYAPVLVSTTAIPPGQGPPMSSTPTPEGRVSRAATRRSQTAVARVQAIASSSGTAGPSSLPPTPTSRARTSSSRPVRRKRSR